MKINNITSNRGCNCHSNSKTQPAFKAKIYASADALDILAKLGDDFVEGMRTNEFKKFVAKIKLNGEPVTLHLESAFSGKLVKVIAKSKKYGDNNSIFVPNQNAKSAKEHIKNFKGVILSAVDNIELPAKGLSQKIANVFDAINSGLY